MFHILEILVSKWNFRKMILSFSICSDILGVIEQDVPCVDRVCRRESKQKRLQCFSRNAVECDESGLPYKPFVSRNSLLLASHHSPTLGIIYWPMKLERHHFKWNVWGISSRFTMHLAKLLGCDRIPIGQNMFHVNRIPGFHLLKPRANPRRWSPSTPWPMTLSAEIRALSPLFTDLGITRGKKACDGNMPQFFSALRGRPGIIRGKGGRGERPVSPLIPSRPHLDGVSDKPGADYSFFVVQQITFGASRSVFLGSLWVRWMFASITETWHSGVDLRKKTIQLKSFLSDPLPVCHFSKRFFMIFTRTPLDHIITVQSSRIQLIPFKARASHTVANDPIMIPSRPHLDGVSDKPGTDYSFSGSQQIDFGAASVFVGSPWVTWLLTLHPAQSSNKADVLWGRCVEGTNPNIAISEWSSSCLLVSLAILVCMSSIPSSHASCIGFGSE